MGALVAAAGWTVGAVGVVVVVGGAGGGGAPPPECAGGFFPPGAGLCAECRLGFVTVRETTCEPPAVEGRAARAFAARCLAARFAVG